MTIEEIENLVKLYGATESNAMYCSHVGEYYDEELTEIAYSKLLEAILQYGRECAAEAFTMGERAERKKHIVEERE